MHCLMLLSSRCWACALSGSVRGRISELMLSKGARICLSSPLRAVTRHQPNCIKPHASKAETTSAAHDTFIDTLYGPICTVHRLISLKTCPTATRRKIRAETAA
jgi:hypothetical protein